MHRLISVLPLMFCAAASAVGPVQLPPDTRLRPSDLEWRTPPGATDGRERAVLAGDPEAGSAQWTYRVRTKAAIQVPPHTHPVDEYITVLEGTWLFGIGTSYNAAKLEMYPPGSFIRIPAGTPHFVATGDNVTVIQSSGSGLFRTAFIGSQ